MTTIEKLALEAATKAGIHAIVIPFIMFFVLDGSVNIAVAFWSVVAWYFIVGVFYTFTKNKQLTAKIYFLIFQRFVLVVAGLYFLLVILAWTISKFF